MAVSETKDTNKLQREMAFIPAGLRYKSAVQQHSTEMLHNSRNSLKPKRNPMEPIIIIISTNTLFHPLFRAAEI